ncbi:hypothetical protein Tco_1533193 [Tanacetum coccineum]
MTTLADKSLLSGGDNKPPMLEKHLYDSWKSRMELYMMTRNTCRMILAFFMKKDAHVLAFKSLRGVTRLKEYVEQLHLHRVQKTLRRIKLKTAEARTSLTKQRQDTNYLYAAGNNKKYTLVQRYNTGKTTTVNFVTTAKGRRTYWPTLQDYPDITNLSVCSSPLMRLIKADEKECLRPTIVMNSIKPRFLHGPTSRNGSDALTEKARESKPKLYDGNTILKMDTIVVPDSDETLALSEESRSKMLLKEQDPLFEKHKLVKERPSIPKALDPSHSSTTVIVEVPKELPKLSDFETRLYTQLYDSIKPKHVQSKEQCDALIKQVNIKSGEISDLNAKLQEQGLVIAALKNELRKLKGKALDNEDTNLKKQDNFDCVGIHHDDCMSSDNLCVSNSLNVVKSHAKPKRNKSKKEYLETNSERLVPNPPSSTPFVPPSRSDWDLLFQPMFDESLSPPPNVDLQAPEVIAPIPEAVAPEHAVSTGSPSSTTVDQDAPSPSNSHTTQETQTPIISHDVEEDNHDIEVAHMGNDPYFGIPIPEVPSDQSSSPVVIHTIVPPDHQVSEHNSKWTKDHPLENIIGALDRPVSTRLQLHEQALLAT